MKIEILAQEKPFSHTPGYTLLIPKTLWEAKVFPAALFLSCELENINREFFWNLEGPISSFTVEQDLKKGVVRVFGESKQGYFRFIIERVENKLQVRFEKTPLLGISVINSLGEIQKTFFKGEILEVARDLPSFRQKVKSQLFLGSYKSQDMQMIRRRKDLKEILPLWYTLGRLSPDHSMIQNSPVLDLLTQTRDAIEKKERKNAYDLLFSLYLTGFSEGLVPRSLDMEFQGIVTSSHTSRSAYPLLSKGADLIQSLFFQEKDTSFYILPCLPSQFVCGKMTGITSQNGSVFHLEWTKHRLRRMYVFVKEDSVLQFVFPSDVKSYRLSDSLKSRGKLIERDQAIEAKSGQSLWFDLFQK